MAGSVTAANTARATFETGDTWTDHVTRLALPVVLWCAKYGHTITYGQLAEELERRHGEEQKWRKTVYGSPAGKIGDLMERLSEEWGEAIPPVNAVIVNGATRLPGAGVDGYLERFLSISARRKRLTERNRNALAEEIIQSVFDYARWDAVAKQFGIKSLPKVGVLHEDELEPFALPLSGQVRGGGGEGELHRILKEWVEKHPEAFAEFGTFGRGKTEEWLNSGDEVDVLFSGKDAVLAVEVKASNAPDSDLVRGLFQCVKYRAVLRAMQLAEGDYPNAQAVLVLDRRLPPDLVRLAKRIRVRWMIVRPN